MAVLQQLLDTMGGNANMDEQMLQLLVALFILMSLLSGQVSGEVPTGGSTPADPAPSNGVSAAYFENTSITISTTTISLYEAQSEIMPGDQLDEMI